MAKKSVKKADQGKVVAILSYITFVGWIIALVIHMGDKTRFGSFHLRQSLLIMITSFVLAWIPVLGWILALVLFVFWVMGLVYAVQGREKEVPLIGSYAQEWFKSL